MAESDPRRRRLVDLQASNTRREKQLAAWGTPLPPIVASFRLEALVRLVVGDNESAMLEFDVAYQEILAETLDRFEAESSKARLLQGVNGSPLRIAGSDE